MWTELSGLAYIILPLLFFSMTTFSSHLTSYIYIYIHSFVRVWYTYGPSPNHIIFSRMPYTFICIPYFSSYSVYFLKFRTGIFCSQYMYHELSVLLCMYSIPVFLYYYCILPSVVYIHLFSASYCCSDGIFTCHFVPFQLPCCMERLRAILAVPCVDTTFSLLFWVPGIIWTFCCYCSYAILSLAIAYIYIYSFLFCYYHLSTTVYSGL